MAGIRKNFVKFLFAEIHSRKFKTTTRYPFLLMIFQIGREIGVPICHFDKIVHDPGTLDIGIIQDSANVAASRRGPQVDMPIDTNLGYMIEKMQEDAGCTNSQCTNFFIIEGKSSSDYIYSHYNI